MGFKRNSLKQLIKWRKALSVSTTLKFGHSRNISGLGVILAKFCVRGFTEFTFYGVEQWRNKQTALDFLSYTASLWWQRQEMVELVKFIEGNLHIERLFENLKPILSRFYYVWKFFRIALFIQLKKLLRRSINLALYLTSIQSIPAELNRTLSRYDVENLGIT